MNSSKMNYKIKLSVYLAAVPLSPLHPKNILLYYANDTNSKLLITTPKYAELMQKVSKNIHSPVYVLDNKLKLNCAQKHAESRSDLEGGQPSEFYDKNNAMILYTSGTTGSPKGKTYFSESFHLRITNIF